MKITPELTDTAVLIELGARLERARLDRNISQEDLATEAGVSRMTVVRAEAGAPVKTTMLVRLLRALTLADRLDLLVPEAVPGPIELLERRGRSRQRAGPTSRKTAEHDPTSGRWEWGDRPAASPDG